MKNLTESKPFNSRVSACGSFARSNCLSTLSLHRPGRGYMEDRRPAANCDPYAVTKRILQTCGEAIVADLWGGRRALPRRQATNQCGTFLKHDNKR